MRALYDLHRFIPTFNFFEFLLVAEMDGATTIVFETFKARSAKWGLPVTMQRFESICVPGPALIGLPYEIFHDRSVPHNAMRPEGYITGGKPLVDRWKAGRKFKRLTTVKPAGSERYTVTLRNTERDPIRNADKAIWQDFAKEIGALVIPDYSEKPIHLHDRIALYAGAEMNFFVSNGPGVFCSFTPYPCMLFNTQQAGWAFDGDGVPHGANYIWMQENQKAIWEYATADTVREHFYHWRDTGQFLRRPGLRWNEAEQRFVTATTLEPVWNGNDWVTAA
jgi:hypothetical protein